MKQNTNIISNESRLITTNYFNISNSLHRLKLEKQRATDKECLRNREFLFTVCDGNFLLKNPRKYQKKTVCLQNVFIVKELTDKLDQEQERNFRRPRQSASFSAVDV